MTVALAMAVGGTALSPVQAHHSFAMFDRNRKTVVQGTVSKFTWTNPHVFIAVDVPGKGGKATRYAIEAASISILSRNGWKVGAVRVGDPVRIAFYPLKNGQPGGLLDQVRLKSGVTLKQ